MKGPVPVGGFGTRPLLLAKITNEHLLPVHDRPMVYHPIKKFCPRP
jgi:glucose-1-phosphate thymidylyltransferase